MKYRLIFFILLLASLVSCEELASMMGGERKGVRLPDYTDEGVDLDENGTATVTFEALAAWKIAFMDVGDGTDWLTVTPEEGEAGEDLTITITAKSPCPDGRTRSMKVEFDMKDGTYKNDHFRIRQHPEDTGDTSHDPGSDNQGHDKVYVRELSINPPGPLTLQVGQEQILEAVFEPSDANTWDLRWNKPDGTDTFDIETPVGDEPRKAKVIARCPGSARITLKDTFGPQAEIDVTVVE